MIKTVIITDSMYRSAISAIYSFKRQGEEVILVTTNSHPFPPSFHSRFVLKKFVLPSNKEEYKKELLELCQSFDMPVLFPIGVFTLDIISENLEEFSRVADFCVSSKETLNKLNDKSTVKKLAISANINVPRYSNEFPLVVKPLCAEKFGLKASKRYKIAKNENELKEAKEAFSFSECVIEEYIDGDGIGVSVVMGKDRKPYSAFCHKRLSEFPHSGGPSCSLVTFRDEKLIEDSVRLLKSVDFVGIAMVEYKKRGTNYYLLEINPRIWGSFGATFKSDSDFVKGYLSASREEKYEFSTNYKLNKKVKFLPNIFLSVISYFKAGKIKKGVYTLIDAINPFVPNAIFNIKDPLPSLCDLIRKRR